MVRASLLKSCVPVLGLLAPVSALAQGSDAEQSTSGSSEPMSEIVVIGHRFLSIDTSGATNLPIPVEEVPQSISIVSGDLIKAADLNSLGEIAELTAGANYVGNPLGLGTVIALRGFGAGRAVDGLSVSSTNFEPDNAIIDRLEIVKGPSSVVYGVSSPGGLVNYVTKSATAATPNYAYGQAGSWNNYYIEGQVTGALDEAGNVRAIVVADYDVGDSFIHTLNHHTGTIYTGINVDITNRLNGYLHGGYTREVRTSFDGIPTESDGSAPPLPRSFFIGSKDMKQRTSDYHAETGLNWNATDLLKVSLKGYYERAITDSLTPYGFDLQDDGTFYLGLQRFRDNTKSASVGLNVHYALDDLGLQDSFLAVSAIHRSIVYREPLEFYGGDAAANIFDGEAAIASAFEALRGELFPFEYSGTNKVDTISAQSLIHPVDPLSVLMGLSYSKSRATETSDGFTDKFDFDGNLSMRFGLTYEVSPGLNTYGSFSQSYLPQTFRTIDGSPVSPLEGNEYEAGIKFKPVGERLLLTAAVYRIIEKNVAAYDQTTSEGDFYRPIGRVRHQGAELEATGEVLPQLELRASYSYLNTRILDDDDSALVGKSELFLPKNSASLYTTYTVWSGPLHGVSLGGGMRYVGRVKTSYDNSTQDLPEYLLFDANLGYAVGGWAFQINARNIFDKKYFINNYQTLYYGNVVGDPANFSLSVERDF